MFEWFSIDYKNSSKTFNDPTMLSGMNCLNSTEGANGTFETCNMTYKLKDLLKINPTNDACNNTWRELQIFSFDYLGQET